MTTASLMSMHGSFAGKYMAVLNTNSDGDDDDGDNNDDDDCDDYGGDDDDDDLTMMR